MPRHLRLFLQLALATNANALVIGDADLLMLGPLRGLAIFMPAQAIERKSRRTRCISRKAGWPQRRIPP
jgi:predicted nucleic acid-binding protein